MGKSKGSTYQFRNVTEQVFKEALEEYSWMANKFARTFLAKARARELWSKGTCIGVFVERQLAGAILYTTARRSKPWVANLQLLHVFDIHRRKGIGAALCKECLSDVYHAGAEYFRVSAEPDAVKFYESLGIKFMGKQKSGSSLAMFKIGNAKFEDGGYMMDDVIMKASRANRGGIVSKK